MADDVRLWCYIVRVSAEGCIGGMGASWLHPKVARAFSCAAAFCHLSTPLLNMANNYQTNLSEQLQLLHDIGYLDQDMRYQHSGTHRKRMCPRDIDTRREVRLLDSIAVALTTGKPGDVFAAAYDKRKHMKLVLAKNGLPTFRRHSCCK